MEGMVSRRRLLRGILYLPAAVVLASCVVEETREQRQARIAELMPMSPLWAADQDMSSQFAGVLATAETKPELKRQIDQARGNGVIFGPGQAVYVGEIGCYGPNDESRKVAWGRTGIGLLTGIMVEANEPEGYSLKGEPVENVWVRVAFAASGKNKGSPEAAWHLVEKGMRSVKAEDYR